MKKEKYIDNKIYFVRYSAVKNNQIFTLYFYPEVGSTSPMSHSQTTSNAYFGKGKDIIHLLLFVLSV